MELPFIVNAITGIALCVLAIFVYFSGNKNRSAHLFSLLSFAISVWIIIISITLIINNLEVNSILTKFNHFLGTLIATIYLLFSYSYPNEAKITKNIIIILTIIETLFVFLILFSNLIIGEVAGIKDHYITWKYGTYWFLLHIYFLYCWTIGIINLYRSYKKSTDTLTRKNIYFMLFAFTIGIIPPIVTSLIMPKMGIYDYYWTSSFSIFLWISLMTSSITRHRLFNIKIITIELAIFALWIVLLVRIFSAQDTHTTAEEIGLLIISVIFGILLIRGTLHEIRQHDHIKKLTDELHRAYEKLSEMNRS